MEAVGGVSYINWKGTTVGCVCYLVCSIYVVLMKWDCSAMAFLFLHYSQPNRYEHAEKIYI